MGLLILECDKTDEISEGDELEIDLDNGIIKNLTTKKEYKFSPMPPFMQELLQTSGLINYAKSKM